MVFRHTINDWFTNAGGRSRDEFRYDWENDDQPDRTPDSWLDGYRPVDRVAASRSARATASRSTSATSHRRANSIQRALASAARALQARMRGVKEPALARHLQQAGWIGVTADQVREALRAHPTRPERQLVPETNVLPPNSKPAQKKQQTVHGTITKANPPTASRKRARATQARERQSSMAEMARALRAKDPKISIEKLTKQVQARGWVTVTVKQVRSVLGEPPRAAPIRKQPKTAPLRRSRPMVAPLEVRAPRPNACLACGVVPSPLGMCRCS